MTLFFSVLLLLAASRLRAQDTDAQELLRRTLAPPAVSYQGLMTVTRWSDRSTRSEEVEVAFRPPNRYRWEFLKPDGSVSRVVVSNGGEERLHFPRHGHVFSGRAVKSDAKRMPMDTEWNLLCDNYVMTLRGTESVAGRAAWVLDLTPHLSGKPVQRLWIDQQYGVILQNKRFRPTSGYAVVSRFSRVLLAPATAAELDFDLPPGSADAVTDHGFDPDFMSLRDVEQATGRSTPLPVQLPDGFRLESANVIKVDGHLVSHVRYTDGLNVISVFQTTRPVRPPRAGHETTPSVVETPVGPLLLTDAGPMMHWQSGGYHYTMMGDLSNEILAQLSAAMK